MKSGLKKLLKNIILLLAVSGLLGSSLPVYAHHETERKTVRVGYAGSENFMGGAAEGERKSGYAYEYLQLVASQTGWDYEYVYGDWSVLFEMLERGEIDIMPGITYTDERAEKLLFPNQRMGTEYYYALAPENSAYNSSQEGILNGAKVGVLRGSVNLVYMTEWNEKNGNPCTIVTYDGYEGLLNAFYSGEVDIIVETDNGSLVIDNAIPLFDVGKSDYYVAVSKERTDLLNELNDCLDEMDVNNPYLISNLQYKYYSGVAKRSNFNHEDREYLDNHPVIRIAYEKEFLSFCGYDGETGECKGALRVFVDNLSENFGTDLFTVELIPYDNVSDSIEALKNGEVDAVFPLYQSYYAAEEENLLLSNEITTTGMTAILNSNAAFDEFENNTVAIAEGYTDIIWFVEEYYPNWTIKFYPTFAGCVNAINRGEADCIVESTYVYKNLVDYRTVKMVALSNGANLCFAVNRGETSLLHIINQMIAVNPRAEFSAALATYANSERRTTFVAFVRDNIGVALAVLFALALILGALLMNVASEQKKTRQAKEELAIALEQAEAASQAKTVFLNNMSHDIRTPMNAIMGFTQLIKNNSGDEALVKDYISKIEHSGDYLLTVINNVLDMARIESGKMELNLSVVDLIEADNGIYDLFKAELQKKNITFIRNINITNRYVLSDSPKATQIALNLVGNAIKYTPDGGIITYDSSEYPCDREGYGKYVLTISDTGIGMSEEFVKTIFEPFTRERTSTESKVIGTGLGMSIVKKLVDILGGTIEVESEPGKGSVFRVTLIQKIVDAPEVEVEQTEKTENVDISGHRILLTEDNDLNAEIAQTILEDCGITVERAKDGAECVDMLLGADAGYYELILMDIQMPNLDGYETTRRIRSLEDSGKANIKIIAMTANAFDEDKKKAYEAGMNGHLAKPIEFDKLMETLAENFK